MDEIWHAAILDTKFYEDLQGALGLALHHRPSGASVEEFESREKRLALMHATYSIFFLAEPIQYSQQVPQQSNPASQISRPQPNEHNNISIIVQMLTGKRIPITIIYHETIRDLKETIEYKEGLPVCHQNLVFQGKELEDDKTLVHYDIGDATVIYLRVTISGC